MKPYILLVFNILFFLMNSSAQQTLSAGMVIKKSTIIKPGKYGIKGTPSGAIVIEGNDITIDFRNAELDGGGNTAPDLYSGTAIYVRSGKNITLRNLKAQGYKLAILAKNIQNLVIENCDLSYNYRQRLLSTSEKEDEADWLSYHNNENDEWLRYGAGIYLNSCNLAVIRNCTITNGQNALLMKQCDSALIYNNNFSFNSGVGIGLYRSSYNKVLYNKLDFNVRGFSDGVYARGQDSAGILVYEQSNGNLFYKNSVTHSGDGLFLWAGQSTMETGQGGCNDNIIMDNDFSYAPTNGVEVTFSRNRIIHNRIFGCTYGIWGGYSFETDITGNQFRGNRTAIAIEHGQYNKIHHNLFLGDSLAIQLWANATQPKDWGYVKYRDTRSVGGLIVGNSFNQNQIAVSLKRVDSLRLFENLVPAGQDLYQSDSTVTNLDIEPSEEIGYQLGADFKPELPAIASPNDPFRGNGKRAGRKWIMMTHWGPYNFAYPFVTRRAVTDSAGYMRFQIFGAAGKWKLVSVSGMNSISQKNGSFPATVTAKRVDGKPVRLVLQYTGPVFMDIQGRAAGGKKPVMFEYSGHSN